MAGALTGMLPAILLIAILLTAPISWLLLRQYRRAVIRSMGRRTESGPSEMPSRADATPHPPARPLGIAAIGEGGHDGIDPEAAFAWQGIARKRRRVTIVYTLAGLAYALVMAAAWIVILGDGFLPGRFSWIAVCHAWPTVIALGMIASHARERLGIAAVYCAVLGAIGAWNLWRNPEATVWQLGVFWLVINAVETVLLRAFLAPSIRAVGPLVLAFMAAGVGGALVTVSLAGLSDPFLRAYVKLGAAFGLGSWTLFALLHVFGFVLVGVAGWGVLRWLGRRYTQKKMSDQALTLDAMWLLFGIGQSVSLVFEGWAWIFAGPVAFACYKLVTHVGFRIVGRAGPSTGAPPMLLILRVFSLGSRSVRLYDAITRRWLFSGYIGMISGPDLATSTVEPHEFLDFMGRRLSRQFVQSSADLENRVAAMDTQPDPDGRFRVSEFFCFADTWQFTMRKLAARANAVLMDLRSFSQGNQGCLYEIGELLAAVPLDRIIFLVDGSTDRRFLDGSLQELWQNVPAESPNRILTKPDVSFLAAGHPSASEMEQLLTLLLGHAGRAEGAVPAAGPGLHFRA